jgi:dienelactone hydrolase
VVPLSTSLRPFLLISGLLAFGCGSETGRSPGGDGGGATDGGSRTRLFTYAKPGELGPFPIGFVAMPFVDETRPELATVDATDHRTLPSVVWYPASEEARDQPKSTYKDYFTPALQNALSALAPPGFLDTKSDSVRDASVAQDGPFPLIVFSHGNGGIGVQSFFLTEYLASHGYIVVCPDHTGNALLTELPNGQSIGPGGENNTYTLAQAAADRPADASFLVDAMTKLHDADPQQRFTGKVDLQRVGLTGHSFGGLTTLLAMEQDDRFDVGAPMAPAVPAVSVVNRPVMDFTATEDHTVDNAATVANYASLTGPKMYISVTDAGHFSFSNGCPLGIGAGDGCGAGTRANGETFTYLEDKKVHEITKYYQTALWGFYLKGVTAYRDDLLAEPFAANVTITRDGMP